MSAVRRSMFLLALVAAPACASSQDEIPPRDSGPVFAPEGEPTPAPPPGPYVRQRVESDGVVVLEVGSRVLVPPRGKGPRIHLVAAVHVAEPAFYASAQLQLDAFDLVLYEGIQPAGIGSIPAGASPQRKRSATLARLEILRTVAEIAHEETGAFPGDLSDLVNGDGGRRTEILRTLLVDGWDRSVRYERRVGPPEVAVFTSDGPDGKPDSADGEAPRDDLRIEVEAAPAVPETGREANALQELARMMGLAYQEDRMDHSGTHWRPSDISVDDLKERMDAAGADGEEFMAMIDGTSITARTAIAFMRMLSKNPKMTAFLKLGMIDSIGAEDDDGDGNGPGGGAENRVVIVARNGAVLEDLRAVLAKEPQHRDIAVFYGAAHMKDMERRIVDEFGYRPGVTNWTKAIHADPKDAGYTPEQFRKMRNLMKGPGRKRPAEK